MVRGKILVSENNSLENPPHNSSNLLLTWEEQANLFGDAHLMNSLKKIPTYTKQYFGSYYTSYHEV